MRTHPHPIDVFTGSVNLTAKMLSKLRLEYLTVEYNKGKAVVNSLVNSVDEVNQITQNDNITFD